MDHFTVSMRSNFYDDHIKAYVDEVGRIAKNFNRYITLQTLQTSYDLKTFIAGSPNDQQKNTADLSRKQSETQTESSFSAASKTLASIAFSEVGAGMMKTLAVVEQEYNHGKF
jgi:hypothetical protein